jgi:hypothetical protein
MQLLSLSVVALAAGALVAPPRPAAHSGAAATTVRYKIEQTSSQEVDATAAGGPKQTLNTHLFAYVSVTLTDTTGGRTVHLVVDSMRSDTGSVIPQPLLDSLKGSAFHGLVGANGKMGQLKPMQDGSANSPIAGLVNGFFPRVKPGMKTGDAWTDTSEVNNAVPNGQLTKRTVTNYKAGANEPRDGAKATRIDAAFSSSLAGSQETPGGTATIEGTGSGTATQYVGADGRYLGGTTNETSQLSVSGAFAPAPIPVNIKQTTTVTVLK